MPVALNLKLRHITSYSNLNFVVFNRHSADDFLPGTVKGGEGSKAGSV